MSPVRIRSSKPGRKRYAPPVAKTAPAKKRAALKQAVEAIKQAATVKQRIDKRRANLRAQGLRPIQIWVPDTRAPGFAEEARRQARLLAAHERTPAARAEITDWEAMAADPWEGLE